MPSAAVVYPEAVSDGHLRIRSADRGDSRFVAWVIQEAARSHLPAGVWDFALPDPDRRIDFLDALASAEARSFFSYQGFLIAELDGSPASALSGYEPAKALGQTMTDANIEAFAQVGLSEQELALFGERMKMITGAMPETPEDRWVVEWVATAPGFRGRGLAQKLLLEILERGRGLGYAGAQIAFLIGNTPAQRIYERVGFKVVDEKRDPDFEAALGCPGIARMHLDL